MRFDSLEPLAWAGIGPLIIPAMIVGVMMMLPASYTFNFTSAEVVSKKVKVLVRAGFVVGLGLFILAAVTPSIIRVLPADDAVKHNAAAIQSWAEAEYGVSIKDGIALRAVRSLDDENSWTNEFPVQGPDGELKVCIEIIDGELQLTGPSEIPKASD